MATFRAPAGDGEVLAVPDFDAVPALVAENRRRLDRPDVVVGGLPLPELRALARREALELAEGGDQPAARARADAPLLLAGHQPELSHPGVWVKNFALNGLARMVGGVPLHLVADTDTLKTTSLRFPVFRPGDPDSVRLEPVAFDSPGRDEPYRYRRVADAERFRSFPGRAAPLWAAWGYEPLLAAAWRTADDVGEAFTAARRGRERRWGCHNLELSVSRLSHTRAYARFVWHVLADLPRFRDVYNAAVRAYRAANGVRSANHPAPELAAGEDGAEAPFWWGQVNPGGARRARFFVGRPTGDGIPTHLPGFGDLWPFPAGAEEFAASVPKYYFLWPRALTLTLFARVCLGDFFVHGIGGGKYDEVTDAIVRDYFGLEPPAYQVLSATLHLPLPAFPSTPADLARADRHVRDLHWNPQRHLPPGAAPELFARKAALAAAEPPATDRAARKAWFRELQRVTEELRPLVAGQLPAAEAEREKVRAEVAANAVLRRRDYAWVLYPEATLRPFLRRFLDV